MRVPFSSLSIAAVLTFSSLAGMLACSDDDGGGTTDAGTSADAAATDAAATQDATSTEDAPSGKKPFGETCNADADCESGACFKGGSQKFCSFTCTMATAAKDCPSPPTSGQCNNQGYCRKP